MDDKQFLVARLITELAEQKRIADGMQQLYLEECENSKRLLEQVDPDSVTNWDQMRAERDDAIAALRARGFNRGKVIGWVCLDEEGLVFNRLPQKTAHGAMQFNGAYGGVRKLGSPDRDLKKPMRVVALVDPDELSPPTPAEPSDE